MIEIIAITFAASIISIAYQILIMPGELLQGLARWININLQVSIFRKLLLCPHCIGGQLSLWTSLGLIYKGYGVECLLSVPCVIVAVYFIVKSNFK